MSWAAPLLEWALTARDAFRCARAGAAPSPFGTDGVGYERLIAALKDLKILAASGDVVEIGTRFGGGALKLSRHLAQAAPDKKLYVIDLFGLDWERETPGIRDLYLPILKRRYAGQTQRQIYDGVVAGRENIVTLCADSKKTALPAARLCFGFIDGNHAPDYVENDFGLIWERLSPGGAVAFHDYRWLYEETTEAIDGLARRHEAAIALRREDPRGHILFLVKR
jgi:hypothetical protein